MDVPGIVQSELDGEDVAASVSLGGEDALYVTPTRTLIYRSESLLSDESVETYPHDAERVTVKDGRRKTRITLTYSLDGERDFTVPSSVADDVLHPVLAGVLNGSGVTDPGETVVQTFRFSELTLIVTSDRLLKHVGSAVWDDDHEQYHFDDATGLDFEEGSVATQIVIEVDGRPQRIKTPNEHIAVVRERLTQALLAYYDVDSLEDFNALVDPQEDAPETSGSSVDFGEGVDPLGSSSGDRPADTSGDPFLDDDDESDSLIGDPAGDDGNATANDDATANADATDAAEAGAADAANASAGVEQDPRRPVSSDDDGSRRAEPANGNGNENARRRAEPADADDATAATTSADAGTADADAGTVDADAGTDDAGVADATTGEDEVDDDTGTGEFAAAGFEPATESGITAEDIAERIDDLETRVNAQNALLEQQQALIQQLIQELRER